MTEPRRLLWTRRRLLRAALAGTLMRLAPSTHAAPDLCRGDVAINDTTALLYSAEAPLAPGPGLRDAHAVWARVLTHPQPGVLVYLHGYNNDVTVDAAGRSRVPDWAAADPAARAGASAKPAAPLVYGLDTLDAHAAGPRPIILVPEDGTLAHGGFWSRTPAGQYQDPARLTRLIADCLAHLACLRRPDGHPYLSSPPAPARLHRLFLGGHSGAGLPLQEAAASGLVLPETGVPTDLWLFDCTYWSDTAHFARFCARWHAAGRLSAGSSRASRFVCVYRPGTETEPVADVLRGEIAHILGARPESLVSDHTPANFETEIAPALRTSGALFLRTHLPHDDIPTYFIPRLLQTSGS